MQWMDWILDLLFPPKCPFCQRLLEEERGLCPRCQEQLPWLWDGAGKRGVDYMQGCYSPLAYRGEVRKAIQRYKFPGNPSYAETFGKLVARCVQEQWDQPLDWVTWAPLSKKRKRSRGFDQAQQMAQVAAQVLGLPCQRMLEKSKNTRPQSSLKGEEARQKNAQGAYQLSQGAEPQGKRILLIDDVITSGATLAVCAKVLMEGGAEKVVGATLAQAGRGRETADWDRP